MNDTTRQCWDRRYSDSMTGQQPVLVLSAHLHLLPATGTALDLACGLGANALLLARRGLATWAWDISAVAIARLEQVARQAGLALHTEVRDVVLNPPEPARFDVIVVSRFLERSLAPFLLAALRPNGLLFYQTFTRLKANPEGGPNNPAYLLDANELLDLFSRLQTVFYRDNAAIGDIRQGLRNEAQFVGQKPHQETIK